MRIQHGSCCMSDECPGSRRHVLAWKSETYDFSLPQISSQKKYIHESNISGMYGSFDLSSRVMAEEKLMPVTKWQLENSNLCFIITFSAIKHYPRVEWERKQQHPITVTCLEFKLICNFFHHKLNIFEYS